MSLLLTENDTIEDLNLAIQYVCETLRTCRTERRIKLLELVDDLLDAKADQIENH